MKRICFVCMLAMFFLAGPLHSQFTENFFKDTTKRSYSGILGSINDHDQAIYFWGNGIGKYSLSMPMIHKIDISGNELWNTGTSALLGFEGYIINAQEDASYLYAFGFRRDPYGFFMAKVDKSNGNVIYEKDPYPVNAEGVLDGRDKGTDSLRIISYTYDGGQGTYNIAPITSITISKLTGEAAPAKPYGLANLVPLCIDADDVAYYYSGADSVIKFNTVTGTTSWKNYTISEGAYTSKPPTNIVKEPGRIWVFGDRYMRCINDTTGQTIWNIAVPSSTYEGFVPYQITFKGDTIYTSWHHGLSGATTQYNNFSKVNKVTGYTYLNGVIQDGTGISYNGQGNLKDPRFIIDSHGDIYLLGYYYRLDRPAHAVKKLTGNGAFISETGLNTDTLVANEYNVVSGYNRQYLSGFLFNDQPCFLYPKPVTNLQQSSVRAAYLQINGNGKVEKQTFFDNNQYQFSSTVVDIQKKDNATYILKKHGAASYVEKVLSDYSLVWRTKIDSCFFIPQAFAIDSSGNICVAGADGNCAPGTTEIGIQTFANIDRLFFLDPNGKITKSMLPGTIARGEPVNLLGDENGFWLIATANMYKLAPTGIGAPIAHGGVNWTSGIFNGSSNKLFLTINRPDSLYLFSSRGTSTSAAFCIAVSKANGGKRGTFLADFPQGYLLHAVASNSETNIAYVSGLTGAGGIPVVIKYNYRTNTTVWRYQHTAQLGEAFKVVQEPAGDLYALVRIIDSTKIIKLNNSTGAVLWQFGKFENDRSARNIDIDVSPMNNTVVAAGSSIIGGAYKPYLIELNSRNGQLINLRVLESDMGEKNYIQAVETMPGSAILVGGNLNTSTAGGRNGFVSVDGNKLVIPPCSLQSAFTGSRDANDRAHLLFNNKSTPDTGAVAYLWTSGKGDSATGRDASFTYTSAGTYKVVLTIRNATCNSSHDTTFTITAIDVCPVFASFSTKKDSSTAGKVIFTNTSIAPVGTRFNWDFGDGSTDTNYNTTHIYQQAGNYTICLLANLNGHCQKTVCDTVTVTNAQGNRLMVYPNPAGDNITFVFAATEPGNYTVIIRNAAGMSLLQQQVSVVAGQNRLNFSLQGVQSGLYIVEIGNSKEKLVKRFIKF